MLKQYIFILFCCCTVGLFADGPTRLDLKDLPAESSAESHPIWSLQGRLVEVRGFWYPLSDEEGILAPSPHLKSCCLNVQDKKNQQVLIKGNFSSLTPGKAVTVEGLFKIVPMEGATHHAWLLDQAHMIQAQPSSVLIWIFLAFLGGLLIVFVLQMRYKKR